MKRLFAIIPLALLLYSCVADPLPINNVPNVTLGENGKGYRDNGTGEEGELMRTSVRLYGNCSVSQTTNIEKRGFYVGKNLEDIQNGTAMEYVVLSKEEAFNENVAGLEIDQTYYFCAFVKDGNKVAKSNIGSFHTKAEGFALVNGLSQDGDIIRAKIADDGGSKIKRVGFCWSLKANPDVFEETISAELGEDGYFSAEIPDMEPETTYYFRAFADNGVSGNRISYSNDLSITSDPVLIDVEKDNYSVGADGGNLTISVTHTYPIDITISTNWIELIDTKSASEKISFIVHPNTEVNEREAKISFSSASGSINQDIIIVQEAGAFCINIPDVNFKAYCVENFDTDGDGEISNIEALDVQAIDVRTENIYSLSGIEYFVNLEKLKCTPFFYSYVSFSPDGKDESYTLLNQDGTPGEFGLLIELDLSQNTNIRWLDCLGNKISALDLSNNIKLEYVNVTYNKGLSTLILPEDNVIGSLTYGATSVGDLDLLSLKSLYNLELFYSKTSKLDISNNPQLSSLGCSGNQLTALDASNNPRLSSLECSGNQLTTLDISNNPLLSSLGCYSNQLTTLDVSNNPQLSALKCADNQLTTLDVSNNPLLSSLWCSFNQLTTLNVSNNPLLSSLLCSDNQLTTLVVSNNPLLSLLECVGNQLTTLDVSNNPQLSSLSCSGNQLTTLDVSNNPLLSSLWCLGDNLTEIWLKTGQEIEDFHYYGNIATIYYR